MRLLGADRGAVVALDPRTGTVRAKAKFANASNTLFPSQFVNVRLLLDTVHDAVVVPVTALRGRVAATRSGDLLQDAGDVDAAKDAYRVLIREYPNYVDCTNKFFFWRWRWRIRHWHRSPKCRCPSRRRFLFRLRP